MIFSAQICVYAPDRREKTNVTDQSKDGQIRREICNRTQRKQPEREIQEMMEADIVAVILEKLEYGLHK